MSFSFLKSFLVILQLLCGLLCAIAYNLAGAPGIVNLLAFGAIKHLDSWISLGLDFYLVLFGLPILAAV